MGRSIFKRKNSTVTLIEEHPVQAKGPPFKLIVVLLLCLVILCGLALYRPQACFGSLGLKSSDSNEVIQHWHSASRTGLKLPMSNTGDLPPLSAFEWAEWADLSTTNYGVNIVMRGQRDRRNETGIWSDLEVLNKEFGEKKQYRLDTFNLTRDDIVLDIGGNLGWFAVLCGKLYPHAKIYTFEPVPFNFALLRWNLARNGVTNVVQLTEGCR